MHFSSYENRISISKHVSCRRNFSHCMSSTFSKFFTTPEIELQIYEYRGQEKLLK